MNHELAKQLQDAGFPQDAGPNWPGWNRSDGTYVSTDKGEIVYHPTLSELIGACGDRFEYLIHLIEEDEWRAHAFGVLFGSGSTPNEAVARLYLSLNQK